jgi:hypothetical protein
VVRIVERYASAQESGERRANGADTGAGAGAGAGAGTEAAAEGSGAAGGGGAAELQLNSLLLDIGIARWALGGRAPVLGGHPCWPALFLPRELLQLYPVALTPSP